MQKVSQGSNGWASLHDLETHQTKFEREGRKVLWMNFQLGKIFICCNPSLGLATKAKGLQGCGPRGSLGVTSHTLESVGKWESEPSHSQGNSHFGRWNPQWTSKISECDLSGQNSMACKVFYIIGKLLEISCLKWTHITHLDIWNISYGQKKGQESNC